MFSSPLFDLQWNWFDDKWTHIKGSSDVPAGYLANFEAACTFSHGGYLYIHNVL